MSPPLRLLSLLLPLLATLVVLAIVTGTPWYAALGVAYAVLAVAELTYLAMLLVERGPGSNAVAQRFISRL